MSRRIAVWIVNFKVEHSFLRELEINNEEAKEEYLLFSAKANGVGVYMASEQAFARAFLRKKGLVPRSRQNTASSSSS